MHQEDRQRLKRHHLVEEKAAQQRAHLQSQGNVADDEEEQPLTENTTTTTLQPHTTLGARTPTTRPASTNGHEELVTAAAELVEDPVLAKVVDVAAQKQAARRKHRKTIIGVALVLTAILVAIVGGLCGNDLCSAISTGSAPVVDTCDLVVFWRVNVTTSAIIRPDALSRNGAAISKSGFVVCTNPTTGEQVVDTEILWAAGSLCQITGGGCQELPYQIEILVNGGDCAQSDIGEWMNFSCQDGAGGGPTSDFDGPPFYIRVTDVQEEDVTYFDDYSATGQIISLSNRGDVIGPHIRIQIFDSEESADATDSEGLLQTVFYYNMCSDPREELSRYGAVQVLDYFYGSETMRLKSDVRTMDFDVLVDVPTKLLRERGEGEEAPTFTIDKVSLSRSFAAMFSTVVDDGNREIITLENSRAFLVASATIDVPWRQNATDRFTALAEVTGTGPTGEACTGTGVVKFLVDYV